MKPHDAGVGAKPHTTHLPSGQWRAELVPEDPRARDLLQDQPFIGYGATEFEAKMDGMQALARAVSKLSDEELASIMTTPLDDASLAGAIEHTDGLTEFTDDPTEIALLRAKYDRSN